MKRDLGTLVKTTITASALYASGGCMSVIPPAVMFAAGVGVTQLSAEVTYERQSIITYGRDQYLITCINRGQARYLIATSAQGSEIYTDRYSDGFHDKMERLTDGKTERSSYDFLFQPFDWEFVEKNRQKHDGYKENQQKFSDLMKILFETACYSDISNVKSEIRQAHDKVLQKYGLNKGQSQ